MSASFKGRQYKGRENNKRSGSNGGVFVLVKNVGHTSLTSEVNKDTKISSLSNQDLLEVLEEDEV